MFEYDVGKVLDYYSILKLELPKSVGEYSDAEITRAYKRRALLLHPDKCSTANATESFKTLGEAYRVLRLKSLRITADRLIVKKSLEHQTKTEQNAMKMKSADALRKRENRLKLDRKLAKREKERAQTANRSSVASWIKNVKCELDKSYDSYDSSEDERVLAALELHVKKRVPSDTLNEMH